MSTPHTTGRRHYYRDILSIGIPIIIGQLGTIVLGFADTLMIGHYGTAELAAAGLVNNIFALVLISYLGFSYGLTPIVGRLYGMGHKQEIGPKLRSSIAANMIVGAAMVALLTVLYFNLHRIGQPEELLPLIRPYFIVNLLSVIFVGVFNTLKQLFDGITHTRVAMWVMVGGNVVNIFFNWMLIYGVGVFPEMGLLGAGISTLGSRVLMTLALVLVLACGKRYALYREALSHARILRADMAEMFRMGLPLALQLGMESAAFSLSCIMVGWLGTIPLAAHQVTITVSQLFYLVLSGMASAMAIRVSHFVGLADWGAVRTNAADGFRIVLLISMSMAVVALIFRHHIGMLFTDSGEVCGIVGTLIIALAVYQFGDGLQYTYANALRGIACVKPLVPYAFIAYFVINLPLGYLLGFTFGFGIYGIWTAFPFGLTTAGLLFRRRFLKELDRLEARG